ncbi:MAG: MoaD/ThiS family protein [Pseudomonadota bacterium]
MKVTVRYFASLREVLGPSESLEVEAGLTVGALRDRLIARDAAHAGALARGRAVRSALNQQMCAEDAPLAEGAEVAFFPPVTGG